MICAGIDAGSRSIKAVLFDTDRSQILASGLADQGVEQERLAAELFEKLLQDAGLERSQISGVVATGYGRNAIRFADTTITEITCHARGVHQLAPDARTIIEIGGQDSKVISLEDGGRVRDFAMNDRCAAGTGRFLEMVAARLDMNWEKLAEVGAPKQKARAHQQHVRGVRRDGNHRSAGRRQAPAGRGGRRAKRHRHARFGAGRPVRFAAGLFHRRRRVAGRHGPRAGGSFGLSGPRRRRSRNSPARSAPPSPPALQPTRRAAACKQRKQIAVAVNSW